MAEAILNHHGKDRFNAKSAGLYASPGQRANPFALRVLSEQRINTDHTSQPVTSELVDWASLILTMTQNHKQTLAMSYPHAVDKIYTLKEYIYEKLEENQFWKNWQEAVADREMAQLIVDQVQKNPSESKLEKEQAIDRLKKAETRVKTMEKGLPNYDIHDPFGSDLEQYRSVCRELTELIQKWVEKND